MVKFWKQYVEFQGITNDDLDIFFRSAGDVKKEDNSKLEITIFNLSNRSIGTFETGKVATLVAGYEDDHGIIFRGMVEKKRSEIVGIDLATHITLKQEEHPALQTKIEGTIPAEYTIEQAVAKILEHVDIPVGKVDETGKTLTRARSFEVQTAVQLIRELAKEVDGFEFFTRDNEAYFIKHETGKVEGYHLSFDNGLLEAKEIEESPGEYSEPEEGKEGGGGEKGYNLKTLLLWKIREGSLVEVDAPNISGTMKVLNYAHTCSKTDFITEMEVKPV